MSECDRESSIMGRPWTTGLLHHEKKKFKTDQAPFISNIFKFIIHQSLLIQRCAIFFTVLYTEWPGDKYLKLKIYISESLHPIYIRFAPLQTRTLKLKFRQAITSKKLWNASHQHATCCDSSEHHHFAHIKVVR